MIDPNLNLHTKSQNNVITNMAIPCTREKVVWTTWPAGDGGLTQGCPAADGSDVAEV